MAFRKQFWWLPVFFLAAVVAHAQTDTTARPQVDTAQAINALKGSIPVVQVKPHSPRRATMLAAVLPGTGQLYNRRYWKAPLVYIGFGIIGYFIYTNNDRYQFYLQAFTALNLNNGVNPPSVVLRRFFPDTEASRLNNITVDALRRQKDQWRRFLEISVLSAAAFYALQIIDANVDAHLRGFDWNSENLSLKLEPVLETQYAGIGLTLRW
ncbi:MAG: DUF5683 domain-containing protein [Cytophagales bacterium]|jgi:hypothetical protein|nr:DUF5683 domain-containing protein [Cytophagales bacterium]